VCGKQPTTKQGLILTGKIAPLIYLAKWMLEKRPKEGNIGV
jgi:hypothetical protein